MHDLRQIDYEGRFSFLADMGISLDQIPDIIWTTESKLLNNGILNRWHYRTRAENNPHLDTLHVF